MKSRVQAECLLNEARGGLLTAKRIIGSMSAEPYYAFGNLLDLRDQLESMDRSLLGIMKEISEAGEKE